MSLWLWTCQPIILAYSVYARSSAAVGVDRKNGFETMKLPANFFSQGDQSLGF